MAVGGFFPRYSKRKSDTMSSPNDSRGKLGNGHLPHDCKGEGPIALADGYSLGPNLLGWPIGIGLLKHVHLGLIRFTLTLTN